MRIGLIDEREILVELSKEVKGKERVKIEEVRKIEEKLSRFNCRKVLVVPREDVLEREPEGIEVLTPEELLKIAEGSIKM